MIQPTNVSRELNNRLEKWRKKLLDLSLKNPLLSMRTNVGLSVWHPTPQPLFSLLLTEQNVEFLPLPISEEGGVAAAIAKVAPDYARRHKLNAVGFDSKDVGFTATSETHVAPTRKRLDASALSHSDRNALEKFLGHTKPLGAIPTIVVDANAQQLTDQLVRMDRTNRQKEDESGVHVLFMAVGMVHWIEGKATRIAPLLLVPVSLQREHPTDPFILQRHDDEIALNPALMHMFVQNHAVEWADTENALAAEKVDFNKIVAAAQTALKGLAFVQMEARLSLFSYAKHHMWNDLAERAKMLEDHPVVQKIVGVPLSVTETLFPNVPKEKLDEVCPPDSVLLPLPADSSQIHAIARVNQGESLVIQGPPGTGKSQTITNLIANLLSQGKRVLFVAEKLTALGVVHERLNQLGLGAFCLELHTQSSSKQHVLTQLQEGLAVRNAPLIHGYNEAALALQNLRLSLNQSLDALHQEYPNGLTIYRAIGRLAQHPNAPIIPGLVFPNILEENTEDVLKRKHAAIKYAQAVRLKNEAAKVFDVWRDLELAHDKHVWELFNQIISDIQNMGQLSRQWPALHSVHPTLDVSSQHLTKWVELVELWKDGADIPAPWKRAALSTSLNADYTIFRNADRTWSHLWSKFSPYFKRSALHDTHIWTEYTTNQEKWVLGRWLSSNAWNKKAAKHFLQAPPAHILEEFCEQVAQLTHAFEEVNVAAKNVMAHAPKDLVWDSSAATFSQRLKWVARAVSWSEKIEELTHSLPQLQNVVRTTLEKEEFLLPRSWNEPNRFEEFKTLLQHITTTCNQVDSLLKANWQGAPIYSWDEVNINSIEKEISHWLLSQSSWTSWRSCERYRHDALQHKLAVVVDAIDNDLYAFDQIEVAMDCTYANAFVNTARMEHPEWVALQGGHREHAIDHFRKESEKFDVLTQKYVVGKLAQRLRSQPIDEWDDMVVFKRETMKKVRHLPTRKLIRKLPKLLPVIKPCLMMSPVSVAEYLSNDVEDFDVVIFDEASQITTADAIGAVSRGKQVVVVGDPKQMPPTRMFSVDDDDETEEGDLDSILTECLGSGMKSVLLNWHYRSRNENLIAFSNKTYYGGELITFPSADVSRSDRGLLVHEVNGVYDRGGTGTNSDEARAIVKALVKHIKDPNCHQSIGVVTFNQKQQNLIENMWDKIVAADPALEQALLRLPQPLTIKNLESVQGDERDVIFFSTTFGKDLDGRFMLNFGPLGQVGGERRLNVAITRARDKMEIFSSFHPNEIDPARVTHQGVRDLREWLMFARGGQFAPALAQSLGMPDSPFELAILEGLHKRGWKVQPQVGCSGYRIDIAVVDPGNPGHYLAGVECDGATYHSFKAARDRDKQRQGVLEGLGWSIVRVWSTDFFENREKELDRVHNQLKQLSQNQI